MDAPVSDGGSGVTSTTDAPLGAGAVTEGGVGCSDTVVLVADWSSVVSPRDGVLTAGRFGLFGVAAANDMSEPDFLSLAVVAADFLPSTLLSTSVDLPALSLPSPFASASSPFDDPEDREASVDADGEDDCLSEDDGESFGGESEDDDSDDEPVGPESEGSAHATPGVVATATPTPNATAKPPTRPTYLA